MIPTPVIAIFDIGKTNKKFFLIDEAYKIVLEQTIQFEEILDEDGDNCDDVNLLTKWVHKSLFKITSLKKYDVKAVNFSAYGASLVYIDKYGNAIAPLYNYLKEYPNKLKTGLYKKYGGAEKISCETASPVLGSLNSGMQLYRIKNEKLQLYHQTKFALHLPQYLSFIISKYACSDITSIGCHTHLWNFENHKYHNWVINEELHKKLAPIKSSKSSKNIIFNNKPLKVGTGLHDSSAALIPYLAVFKDPFILISTGTWCISLNPFNNTPLNKSELKKDCLSYMGYNSKPVKASRLFAGYEHEMRVKKLANHFKKTLDYYKAIKYSAGIVTLLQKKYNFKNKVQKGKDELQVSFFGTRDLAKFKSYEEAYHCFLLDLMQQQYQSTQLVITGTNIKRIFVDGGFSKNSIYMHLLALAFPTLEIFAASVAQATAIGAALAIHKKWNNLPIPADMVKLEFYKGTENINNNPR